MDETDFEKLEMLVDVFYKRMLFLKCIDVCRGKTEHYFTKETAKVFGESVMYLYDELERQNLK